MAMTLRLTDEDTDALRQRAAAEGISMQEVALKAVRQYVSGWQETRDSFLEEFAASNASLLDRLGQ